MESRSWIIFKNNGTFYMFYNHFDSYPMYPGLGDDLVFQIRKWDNNKIEEIKKLINTIPLTNGEENIGRSSFDSFYKNLNHPIAYTYRTSNTNDIHNHMKCEYYYIIDLDSNIFTVEETAEKIKFSYSLFQIPYQWW